jgi:hypothetical protein
VDAPILAANFTTDKLRPQLRDFLATGRDARCGKLHFNFAWNEFPFAGSACKKDLCEFLPATLV